MLSDQDRREWEVIATQATQSLQRNGQFTPPFQQYLEAFLNKITPNRELGAEHLDSYFQALEILFDKIDKQYPGADLVQNIMMFQGTGRRGARTPGIFAPLANPHQEIFESNITRLNGLYSAHYASQDPEGLLSSCWWVTSMVSRHNFDVTQMDALSDLLKEKTSLKRGGAAAPFDSPLFKRPAQEGGKSLGDHSPMES